MKQPQPLHHLTATKSRILASGSIKKPRHLAESIDDGLSFIETHGSLLTMSMHLSHLGPRNARCELDPLKHLDCLNWPLMVSRAIQGAINLNNITGVSSSETKLEISVAKGRRMFRLWAPPILFHVSRSAHHLAASGMPRPKLTRVTGRASSRWSRNACCPRTAPTWGAGSRVSEPVVCQLAFEKHPFSCLLKMLYSLTKTSKSTSKVRSYHVALGLSVCQVLSDT